MLGKIREGSLISDDHPGDLRRGVKSEGVAGKQERRGESEMWSIQQDAEVICGEKKGVIHHRDNVGER